MEPWLARKYADHGAALLFHLILEIIAAVLSGLRGYLLFIAAVVAVPILFLICVPFFGRRNIPRTGPSDDRRS